MLGQRLQDVLAATTVDSVKSEGQREEGTSSPTYVTCNLDATTSACESALAGIQAIQTERLETMKRVKQLEAKIVGGKESLLHLGELLHCMHGSSEIPAAPDPKVCGIGDAIQYCNEAVAPLRDLLNELQNAEKQASEEASDEKQRPKSPQPSIDRSSTLASTTSSGSITVDDFGTCSLCLAAVGKRHFNLRHHCRVCGNTVCGKCSPHTVMLQGAKQAERACSKCLEGVGTMPQVKQRMMKLGHRLHALGTPMNPFSVAPQADSLEEVLRFCENAVGPLEEQHEEMRGLAEKANEHKANKATQKKDAKHR